MLGFRCTHYSVTESSGHVVLTVEKRVPNNMTFYVRTRNDTAKAPNDYEHLETAVTMSADESEHQLRIKVIDDNIWEPDKDFFVEIFYDKNAAETGVRLPGDDTICTVTILDEDHPGQLTFEHKSLSVRKKDRFAYVRVVRNDGCDG